MPTKLKLSDCFYLAFLVAVVLYLASTILSDVFNTRTATQKARDPFCGYWADPTKKFFLDIRSDGTYTLKSGKEKGRGHWDVVNGKAELAGFGSEIQISTDILAPSTDSPVRDTWLRQPLDDGRDSEPDY